MYLFGKRLRIFCIINFIFLFCPFIYSQNISSAPLDQSTTKEKTELTRNFQSIELGMDLVQVRNLLQKNSLFAFRGPEDVSLLPKPNQSLIEVNGKSFILRASFQFYEDKLWTIIINFNTTRLDHYTIYSKLSDTYGNPLRIHPTYSEWENGVTRISLEKPLTLRYVDLSTFFKLQNLSQLQKSDNETEKEEFLDSL